MLRVGGFKIGLEGRLFLIVFVVAAVISLFLVGFVYNREKASAEKALADELIRAARIFASMLDPEDVARIPHEPPDSPLVRRYQELAQHVVDSAGLANAYTCSPVRPGQCAFGIVNSSIGIDPGTLYDYGQTAAAEAWTKAFAGEMAASPIHRDEYGEWMNGVVPIRDASGRVIALAAVDVEASHVRVLLGRVLRQVMVMGVVLVAIWLGIAVVIARTVLRPVTTALARFGVLVGRVAEGDLTMEEIPVRSEDEVGRLAGAFNQMVARLRELMRQVAESTDVVFNAAQGLTAASEQSATGARQAADLVMRMAHATAQQAKLAGDVRSTVKELQGAIVQIADGAAKSSEEMQQSVQLLNAVSADIDRVTQHSQAVVASAERAAEGARRGRQTMRLTVAGMARIREAVDNTAAQVRELEQLSTQIGEITNLISDIADQTNLLALNAAIEAARAGEHGRGFAVVADEVRRLAEHTAMSAREINELIQNTQARTAEAARAMEIGMKEVANGNQLASEADDALEQILALVEEAVDGMQKIAAAGEQIKIRTQQVVVAFDDLAMVTDENTAATEQMSASAGMVDENVSQLATLSQENAAAAKEVSASVEELSASAAQVAQSAETLIQTANQLQEQVRRFRV